MSIYVRNYLQEQKRLPESLVTKAHSGTSDSSQKLETWSTLPNLKAAGQIGNSPFQVALLFQEAWLASSFSRQEIIILIEYFTSLQNTLCLPASTVEVCLRGSGYGACLLFKFSVTVFSVCWVMTRLHRASGWLPQRSVRSHGPSHGCIYKQDSWSCYMYHHYSHTSSIRHYKCYWFFQVGGKFIFQHIISLSVCSRWQV